MTLVAQSCRGWLSTPPPPEPRPCVKTARCLRTYTNRTNHQEEDQALRHFMFQNKMLSSSFQNVLAIGSTSNDFNKFRDYWRETAKDIEFRNELTLIRFPKLDR